MGNNTYVGMDMRRVIFNLLLLPLLRLTTTFIKSKQYATIDQYICCMYHNFNHEELPISIS